jgi:CheY-like chemotaxis protein
MPELRGKVLVVEDEPSIRMSMSAILSESGYAVRLAEDGFSALRAIRQEMPSILISDLKMPGMTGLELLSVVRRRFPAIRTIAMSGAYSGTEVPAGIVADAFYSKGSGVQMLLQILDRLPATERHTPLASSFAAPLWIYQNKNESPLDAGVSITCPECLRTFSQAIHGNIDRTQVTKCRYCDSPIHFAMINSAEQPPLPLPLHVSTETEPARAVAAQYYY